MKTAVILHGVTGYAGNNWQQWLHDELLKKKWKVVMPDLPLPDHPDRKEWLMTIKSLVAKVAVADIVFIGHSLGVVCALDFIEQVDTGKVMGLVSVSGFCSDYQAELNSYFLRERKIDFDKIRAHLKNAVVVYGDNDPYVPQEKLEELARELRVEPTVISGGGHLNKKAGYTEFPQLLKIAGNLLS